jgi:outer membrane protein assembly factor BamB
MLLAAAAMCALIVWINGGKVQVAMRVPGTDLGPDAAGSSGTNPVFAGKLVIGPGTPGQIKGNWPQFRGPGRDGISPEQVSLSRDWSAQPPREIWRVEVGEGYAGPAVSGGRVYLMDYDREKKQDALRCLSFDDGQEIWSFAYPIAVKRNHGMSRTVPAISSNIVVAMGPKCHVVALEPETGNLMWGLDLVRQFGTTVPPWYAGQCPLIDGQNVILAPGGKDALLVAVSVSGGEVVWKSSNPRGWKMTHSSVMPMEIDGRRMYVYCGDKGVAGVSADDGRILWETTEWKISIATVPSPVILDDGRIFLSGGYNAGSIMLKINRTAEGFAAETLYRMAPEVFGATQQTPVLFEGAIYGVRPDGRFACISLEGKPLWTSDGKSFGLGPFVLGGGMIYALNDTGLLRIFETMPNKYGPLGQQQVIDGRECWGPLVLTSGRLLARDLTRLICLDVSAR